MVGDSQPAWLHWPGSWGDTRGDGGADSNSPISPGRRPHWIDPLKLTGAVTPTKVAPATPPPTTTVRRERDTLVVAYDAPPEAETLVVATRPKGSDAPAQVRAFPIERAKGEVEIPAQSGDDEVWTSVAAPGKSPSEAV